jgi:hypothetical protein
MKNILLAIMLLAASLFVLSSCSSGDDDDDNDSATTDDTGDDDDLSDDADDADDDVDDTIADDTGDDTVTDDDLDDSVTDDDSESTTTTTGGGTTTTTHTTTTTGGSTTTTTGSGLVCNGPCIGFQYYGYNGAWAAFDLVTITDSSNAVTLAEDFEGGSIPADWYTIINNPSYTWDVYANGYGGAGYAYSGTYSPQISWAYDYSNQDEWMIIKDVAPAKKATGPYTMTFWNVGSTTWAPYATLYVKYSCDNGNNWTTLYTFPGTSESSWTWYEESVDFDCTK